MSSGSSSRIAWGRDVPVAVATHVTGTSRLHFTETDTRPQKAKGSTMIIRCLLLLRPIPFLLTLILAAPAREAPPPPVAQSYPAAPALLDPAPQQVYGPSPDTLIARQAADGILEGFRKVYARDSAPRIVVYVNRALVDTTTGLKPTRRLERYQHSDTATSTSGVNVYTSKEGTSPTLADQQTVREVERLFGRAFRHAGAQLADQATAAALLPTKAGAHLTGDPAAKDREALSKIADIAIEVLISSRHLTVQEISGDVTYPVPDIQATAIRLRDSAIVGQAAASDIIGRGVQAGRIIRQFDVSDITEATAIALMEDMLIGMNR